MTTFKPPFFEEAKPLTIEEQVEAEKGELLLDMRDTVEALYKNSASFDAIVTLAEFEDQDLSSVSIGNLLGILTGGLDRNIKKLDQLLYKYDLLKDKLNPNPPKRPNFDALYEDNGDGV